MQPEKTKILRVITDRHTNDGRTWCLPAGDALLPGEQHPRVRTGLEPLTRQGRHQQESEVAQSCPTLRPHGLQPTRLLRPWDFPGKNTGVGCYFLLQEIFPTQGSNPPSENVISPLFFQVTSFLSVFLLLSLTSK